MNLVNEHFGRILLGLALVLTLAGIVSNPSQTLEAVPESLLKRPVQVELDKSSLAALGTETFFTPDDGSQFAGTQRSVWVKEKLVLVFQPVDLGIPPAGIMRPPQLLPEPGPSLEGSHKLPRFGDEFPPILIVDPNAKPKSTTGAPLDPKAPVPLLKTLKSGPADPKAPPTPSEKAP